MMRKLKITFSELEMAFDSGRDSIAYFLDTENGKVVMVTDDDRSALELIYQKYYDKQTKTVDWEAAFQNEDIRDWQQDSLKEAHQVEAGYGRQYISIPEEDPHEGYHDMEKFIATVDDAGLAERLDRAISGRGAFRYFKDVLFDYPKERERWFQFKDKRFRQRILDWLASEGITLAE